ncbi:unnamed protein product, partial [Prorocentrum cordatum]
AMRGARGAAARRGHRCGAWLWGAAVALVPSCRAAAAATVAPAAGTTSRGVTSPTNATPVDTVSAVMVTANASAEASMGSAAGTVVGGTTSATSASAANASTGGARAPEDCSRYPDCPVDCTKCKQASGPRARAVLPHFQGGRRVEAMCALLASLRWRSRARHYNFDARRLYRWCIVCRQPCRRGPSKGYCRRSYECRVDEGFRGRHMERSGLTCHAV